MGGHVLDKGDYDVLNVVALKKMATVAAIAEACGRDVRDVDRALTRLSDQGLVVVVGGAGMPTNGAETVLATSADGHYQTLRQDEQLLGLVDRFDDTNAQLLAAMSAWQQVDVGGKTVPNDHRDSEYDERVITRIERLVQRLDRLLTALASHDPRFAGYRVRLERALREIDRGRREFVSSPTLDSVHSIWFEFHEDLLRSLGRERKE
jgi:hypothetical protein